MIRVSKEVAAEQRKAEREKYVEEKVSAPGRPFVAPSYAEVVKIGASAIANEMMRVEHGALPVANILDLMHPEVRGMCMTFSKVVVDAVSSHGRKKAEEAAGAGGQATGQTDSGSDGVSASPDPNLTCKTCGALEVKEARSVDAAGGTTTVKYACNAESLVFDMGTEKQQVRARRDCTKAHTNKIDIGTITPEILI